MDAYLEVMERERRLINRILGMRLRVVPAILAVCAVLWALTCWSPSSPFDLLRMPQDTTLTVFGAQVNGGPEQRQLWRLLSAAFLHIGLLHLAFNGYALWVIGSFQERFFGRGRFLLVYVLSALAGGVATWLLLPPQQLSAGASGAVFGLLGAQFVVERMGTLPAPLRRASLWRGVLPWILGNLLLGVIVNSLAGDGSIQLNNYAHLGGLFGGALVTLALRGAPGDGETTPAALAGWGLGAVALACCAMGVWNGVHQDAAFLLFGHPL